MPGEMNQLIQNPIGFTNVQYVLMQKVQETARLCVYASV